MLMLGIVTLAKVWPQADGTGDREIVILNDGLIPNVRVVRVAISTGYRSWTGKSTGVAKRPRERSPTPIHRYDSPTIFHRCTRLSLTRVGRPQLHRTVSDNITYGKMVTWFVTSPPTDNSPQPKEAQPTVSQL
jgi:hypothetical protein